MCLHPKYIDLPNKRPTMAQPYRRIHAVVPCGHCIECLKQRQSNFATRIYLEARKGKQMFFVTFTYNNDSIPLAMRVETIDKSSGEILGSSPYEILSDEAAANFRSRICELPSTSSARYIYHDICEFDNCVFRASITPSLNRLDVRNWLKKRRIQYEREFGEKLPDFTYAFCGEYGPKGGRPHYHGLFMGLTYEQLSWLLLDWNLKKGYTLTKEIPILNPDGTDARLIVARYVGKYLAKGKFDLDSCLRGDCEKGRLCNSLNLGNILTDELVSYYRAYDIAGGEYNLDTFQRLDGSVLTEAEVNSVVAEVRKRSKISLGVNAQGKSIELPLPNYLKKKLFCIKDEYYDKIEKSFKKRYVGSVLSSKIADAFRSDFVSKNFGKYKSLYPEIDISKVCIETYFEILILCKSAVSDTKKLMEEVDVFRQYFRNEKDNQ